MPISLAVRLIPINHRYERLRLLSTCLRARYAHTLSIGRITGHACIRTIYAHGAELVQHTVNRKQDVTERGLSARYLYISM